MQWDNVQTSLRNAGHLVYAMDQAQTEVLMTPGPWGSAADGYCLGLATRWIQLRGWDSDFEYDAATQECEVLDWRATVLQNVGADTPARTDQDKWDGATAAHGMRVDPGLVQTVRQPPSGAILTQLMTRAHGWYGISLVGQTAAHAIAAEHAADGTFRMFDANYGQTLSPDAHAFERLMDWYFAFTGYDAQFGRRTAMIGVDP